jgi:hypothetical protein
MTLRLMSWIVSYRIRNSSQEIEREPRAEFDISKDSIMDTSDEEEEEGEVSVLLASDSEE